ncbi:MAG: hypothetical protein JNL97_09675 [Verrucomicrobiales bacterium]|nr:hypothetical protein [Verrucomicrobiales bacterium]
MLAFVPPSIGMAMVYAGWVQRATDEEGTASGAVGWNCLGAALAGPVWAGIVLPATGLKGALLGVAGGYFALVPRRCWKGRFWAWPAAFAGVVGVVAAGRSFLELPPGAEVVRRWDGRLASVAVVRTADRERVLRVNNHFQQGGTATAVAARRQAHIPLLLHPGPRRALFLGVGTGITLGAAVDHPGLIAEGVELLPEVAGALAYFAPENRSVGGRSGPVVRVADARRFVRATDGTYDVIVADLFHPAEDGAGMLYTREHFGAIRRRLAEGGLFCQWLPLHQLDGDGFRDVAATFAEVFPETSLWLMRFNADVPVVGLIGGEGRLVWDGEGLARRMAAEPLASALKPLALTDPVRLWGCRLASRESLRRSSGGGAVATDDLPRVMFGAARSVYREGLPPHRTLETLFRRAEPDFRQSVGVDAAGSPWVARLEAFRIARDRHLTGLGKEIEGRMPEALEDYLASAEASADYTAGYGQAVLVASAYARENPGLARSILERLVRGRPELGLAKEMLARLSKAP